MNISVESSRRIVVAELHRAEHKSSGIIKETGCDASIVDRTAASLKQGNGIQIKTHSLRSTRKFLGGLKLSIAIDLSQSWLNWKGNKT